MENRIRRVQTSLFDLTLSDLQMSNLRSVISSILLSCKGAALARSYCQTFNWNSYMGHMLLLNTPRKLYIVLLYHEKSSHTLSFDLEWPWTVNFKITQSQIAHHSVSERNRATPSIYVDIEYQWEIIDGQSDSSVRFDVECSWKVKYKFSYRCCLILIRFFKPL